MRNLTKKLLFSTAAVATVAFATPAFAQQKGDTSTWYEEQIVEPVAPTKKQMRQQMLADQRTFSIMQQHAVGEFAARPTSRFPNFMSYEPSMSNVYYARPNRWYRAPYAIGWY